MPVRQAKQVDKHNTELDLRLLMKPEDAISVVVVRTAVSKKHPDGVELTLPEWQAAERECLRVGLLCQ